MEQGRISLPGIPAFLNMLQLVPQLRILLAVQPTDFRKGLDSLAALCRGPLQQDPFSGTLFVFRNRTGTALKLVVYDGIGFWLCVRRFSSGTLVWWPSTDTPAATHQAGPAACSRIYRGSRKSASARSGRAVAGSSPEF